MLNSLDTLIQGWTTIFNQGTRRTFFASWEWNLSQKFKASELTLVVPLWGGAYAAPSCSNSKLQQHVKFSGTISYVELLI